MSFKTNYSNVKEITLDGSLYCLDGLDYFCRNKRAANNCSYFGYRYDPMTNQSYYVLLDLPYKFELGSVVTRDDKEIIITDEANNTKYIFNFEDLLEIAKYQNIHIK